MWQHFEHALQLCRSLGIACVQQTRDEAQEEEALHHAHHMDHSALTGNPAANIEALIIMYTILGAPYCEYSIMGPEPYSNY